MLLDNFVCEGMKREQTNKAVEEVGLVEWLEKVVMEEETKTGGWKNYWLGLRADRDRGDKVEDLGRGKS